MEQFKGESFPIEGQVETASPEHFMVDGSLESSESVSGEVADRLREAGWSDSEIGEFAKAIPGALKKLKKASVSLEITDDRIEVVATSEEDIQNSESVAPDFSADDGSSTPDKNDLWRIIDASDGVDFSRGMVRMWKLRKSSAE